MSFGMFSEAGDTCIAAVIDECLQGRNLPLEIDEVEILQDHVMQKVHELGKGKSHPSKYEEGSIVHGFNEVYDTAVRESIWQALENARRL